MFVGGRSKAGKDYSAAAKMIERMAGMELKYIPPELRKTPESRIMPFGESHVILKYNGRYFDSDSVPSFPWPIWDFPKRIYDWRIDGI